MKRLILYVTALLGFAAAPAAAQSHVSVAVAIGTPHVAGYVTLGRPHAHRSGTVIILGAPRVHVLAPSIGLVRAPARHGHYGHHRHHRHHRYEQSHGHGHAHGAGVCGGGYGCR